MPNPVSMYEDLGGPTGNEWWMNLGKMAAQTEDRLRAQRIQEAAQERADFLAAQQERRAGVAEERAATEAEYRANLAKKYEREADLAIQEHERKAKEGETRGQQGERALDIKELLAKGNLEVRREGNRIKLLLGERSIDVTEALGKRRLDLMETDPRRVTPGPKPVRDPYALSDASARKDLEAARIQLLLGGSDPNAPDFPTKVQERAQKIASDRIKLRRSASGGIPAVSTREPITAGAAPPPAEPQVGRAPGPAPSPAFLSQNEGKKVKGPDGRVYLVKNGQLILVS